MCIINWDAPQHFHFVNKEPVPDLSDLWRHTRHTRTLYYPAVARLRKSVPLSLIYPPLLTAQ